MPFYFQKTIGDILYDWADFGVFAYLLPFLMIFAIVFGILNKTTLLGENKGVQATIALAVGLMALQFDYVAGFYASIFPYAGMGIAILLIAMIFIGAVSDKLPKNFNWVWVAIGAIIFIIILITSLSDMQWIGGLGYGWVESWPAILAGFILLLLMGLVVWGK